MTRKSRKPASKKSVAKSTSRPTTSTLAVESVKDVAVLKRDARVPNTSALKPVSRVLSGTNIAVTEGDSAFAANIGDPRNDENLTVSQFHHAVLKFHNQVVDLLITAAFPGDIFVEANKIVTHRYQWCVVHDFLPRVCGAASVNAAISSVHAPVGSAFNMPAEFAMAAYRFGHSMIRTGDILSSSLPARLTRPWTSTCSSTRPIP